MNAVEMPTPRQSACRTASMGPRRERRGDVATGGTSRRDPVLQWGHGDERRGNDAGSRRRRWPSACFNGATAVNAVETRPVIRVGRVDVMASMGPRRERRGNRGTAPRPLARSHGASMGPRRERRGNVRRLGAAGVGRPSFNGATAVNAVETATLRAAQADVAPLQWGHGGNAVETRDRASCDSGSAIGFNGATAGTPWKLADGRSGPSARVGASMGPRRERRGNDMVACRPTAALTTLQWGHGGNAVETRQAEHAAYAAPAASMGPRRERRGDEPGDWSRR